MAAKKEDNLSKEKLLAEIERLRRAPMPRIFDNIEQSLLPAMQEIPCPIVLFFIVDIFDSVFLIEINAC